MKKLSVLSLLIVVLASAILTGVVYAQDELIQIGVLQLVEHAAI